MPSSEKGVNDRYELIHQSAAGRDTRAIADECIQDVLHGQARADHSAYPSVIIGQKGMAFLSSHLLEHYLDQQEDGDFPYEEAQQLCERLRQLDGWGEIDYTLNKWAERHLHDMYLRSGSEPPGQAPLPLLRFGCYIAIGYLKYGPSYAHVTANRILGWVDALDAGLVKGLQQNGTGALPPELRQLKTAAVTCTANDAFGTIRIVVKEEGQQTYETILLYLCALLQQDFPRSFAIEFRSPSKGVLPIKGLPNKGVHQLFANAVQYPELYPLIEHYARLAMKRDEWYTDLDAEQGAMPGTFAVFGLAMAEETYWPLACEYLTLCDDEHALLQEKFIHAFIQANGLTTQTMPVLLNGAASMQTMKPGKGLAELAANPTSLQALAAAKRQLSAYVADDEEELTNEELSELEQLFWDHVCYVIWGKASAKGGQTVLDSAPEELRELYQEVFAPI